MPVSISGTTGYAGPLGAITVDTASIQANAVTPAKMSRSGTSGQVLTSGGAGADPSYTTLTGYAGVNAQIFTGTGTFTVPTGITTIKVTCIGGGGGGAGSGASNQGTGGGAGGTAIDWITGLTPGASITATIGTAGSGGGAGNTNGTAGGTSSFGSYCSATGGAGGVNQSSARPSGGSGTISIGSGITYTGGAGGVGSYNPCFGSAKAPGGGTLGDAGCAAGAYTASNIPGGAGMFGRGAFGSGTGAGAAATGYGNGGGGSVGNGSTNTAGGSGTAGIIIVEW